MGIADSIKESAPEAVQQLYKEGVKVVMVTGDNATTANAVARKLGIDESLADVLPEQKIEAVKRLQNSGKVWRWLATALTTLRRWRGLKLELRWARYERGASKRRCHFGEGRFAWDSKSTRFGSFDNEQYQTESVLALLYNSIGVPIAAGVLFIRSLEFCLARCSLARP